MSIANILAIILAAASVVTALSVLYGKFIRPIKKVVKQVENNKENIKRLEEKVIEIKKDRMVDNEFSREVRAILLESLIAILDGLEQNGANHMVTEQKQKLIIFLTKQVNGK